MEINIIKILPKENNWIVKELKNNKIKVNYIAKRGNYNRKSFIFPKKILIDEKFVEALALYLGDGDFNNKDKRHLTFVSKDKDLVGFFLNFLRNYFRIKNKDITTLVHYKKSNNNLVKEWSNKLKIDRILTKYSNRHKEETCHIQINGVIFRLIFESVINNVLTNEIISDENSRRAFLRGIFAAEGSIGIDYLEKKPYISQITFNLSIKEKKLKNIISECLLLESVTFKVRENIKDNSLEINIQNWKNYIKLYNINLFYLCKRKQDRFNKISKNLNVHIKFKPAFRKYFFESLDMYQKDIAKKIDSWQANVSRTVDGTHLLRVEQILKLLNYSNYSKKDIVNNIEDIRIGSLTNLKPNHECIKFLKEYKSI